MMVNILSSHHSHRCMFQLLSLIRVCIKSSKIYKCDMNSASLTSASDWLVHSIERLNRIMGSMPGRMKRKENWYWSQSSVPVSIITQS